MYDVISQCFKDFLRGPIYEILNNFQNIIEKLYQFSFHIENDTLLHAAGLSPTTVSKALTFSYGVLVLLLVVKLLWKGYKVYVLWRDGEAENSPAEMLTGAVLALVTAIAFPFVYNLVVDILGKFMSSLLFYFKPPGVDAPIAAVTQKIQYTAGKSQNLLIRLAMGICLIAVSIQMLARGAELLLYRLGVPLAATGLIDSDGGVWKTYIQSLIRQLLSIMCQYFFMMVGACLMSARGPDSTIRMIIALGFEIAAFRTPKIISQIVLPSGGGGGFRPSSLFFAAKSFFSRK